MMSDPIPVDQTSYKLLDRVLAEVLQATAGIQIAHPSRMERVQYTAKWPVGSLREWYPIRGSALMSIAE